MSDERRATTTVEAAFADAAQAERAVARLQQHGVAADRIDVGRGGTAAPGRTAADDREIADRVAGSWIAGSAAGTVLGAAVGAIVGALTFGALTGGFWALVIGCGAAGGGVGALWGMFAGFTGRGRRTRSFDDRHPPQLRDAVTVQVAADPGDLDTVRRVLRDAGGAD